jgi:integrase/recombinase XerC
MTRDQAIIQKYLSYLSSVRGVSERTLEAYDSDLSQFAGYCRNYAIEPDKAGAREVQGFIAELSAERRSPASVNRALSSVRGFYRWMLRFGERKDNPCTGLRNVKNPQSLPLVLWEEEMAGFAELPDTAGILWPERDKALIMLMYSAGLRISELAGLSTDDFLQKYEGARITGKGGKERYVFFSDEGRAALLNYLPLRQARLEMTRKSWENSAPVPGRTGSGSRTAHQTGSADQIGLRTGNKLRIDNKLRTGGAEPEGKVFISRKGRAISISGVRWIIAQYAQRSGLNKNIHPHSLRHSFATHLVNSGCDVRIVQELLGHASLSTTQRYTHVSIEGLKKVYSKAHPHGKQRGNINDR